MTFVETLEKFLRNDFSGTKYMKWEVGPMKDFVIEELKKSEAHKAEIVIVNSMMDTVKKLKSKEDILMLISEKYLILTEGEVD